MWTDEKPGAEESRIEDFVDRPPSAEIAFKLSETLEKDVTDIEPIGNQIDTDALNRLFQRSAGADFRFEFTHAGCHVELDPTGIEVDRLDSARE
ncbi:HalOD1 output domain-containing protein [Halomicroarcula sp. GCM10025817]|uniref:HalOD1 output domain-containing protein n=1 Tax=Haloarcula TaxID=2237 RepID=UPI0023E88CCE|nr:HalOD1 output domain-containing protein [Halomicroarcula sp. SYNS111]